MVRNSTDVEYNIVAVERLQEYVDLKPDVSEMNPNNRPHRNGQLRGASSSSTTRPDIAQDSILSYTALTAQSTLTRRSASAVEQ
ncbi:hypothetical protein BGZ54_009411, partial [Gamsiella multidivaricata]